jgi:UMF1 family MFS transporter
MTDHADKPGSKRPWLTRPVFGWAMFDFANQAFTLVILTTMFQVYFVSHVVPGDESLGRKLWAVSGITTQVIIIVISPILGALADFSGAKKKLLFVTYVGCVMLTAALGLIPPGGVALGMTLFIGAYLFYAAGENFMASFLPELASHRDMGKVSAFGWTLGYIGGLLCLGGAIVVTLIVPVPTGYRWVCVWAGAFFLLAALPTFLFLHEHKQPEQLEPGSTYLSVGFTRLGQTFREIRHYKHLFRYLAIMSFYFAGVQIVYWFSGTITKVLFNFSDLKMAIFILQLTVTAIFGAILTGRYQDRIGTRVTILICLAMWMLTTLGAAFATKEWMFWTVGNLLGLGVGALGTASRSMVGLFSPQHKAAEFFGFYGLAHKLSAILGLGSITLAEYIFRGNFHLVVASGATFFLGGLLLMLTVDEKDGRTAAKRAAREHVRKYHDYEGALPDHDDNRDALDEAE